MDVPKVNGKGWLGKGLLQLAIILALVAYSAVLTVKEMNTPKQPAYSTNQDAAVIDRLARIETKIDGTNARVDRLERKLDTHMEK
jgi:hypothetical protein